MIEFGLDLESYFEDGIMFTEEIHDDADVFFHGTSGEFHDLICSEGIVGLGNGLVTKKRVQSVVEFYSEIGWEGYAPFPIGTLSSFTRLDFKDRDVKQVYLSKEAHTSLKYSFKSVAGGETVTAIRDCAGELLQLANEPEDLDVLGVGANLINSFLNDNEDIFDFAIGLSENYPFGCVYAISYRGSKHPESKAGSTYVDSEVLPSQIIAYCKIPIGIDEELVRTSNPLLISRYESELDSL